MFNVKSILQRRIPILVWLPTYTFGDFIADLVAGITVGLTLIPQVIAYAALAGLSPQYGLYSSLMGGFVYVILGSTPQLCVGPTALISLLTFTYTEGTNMDMVILLTFLSGCITTLCGIFHLGFLVDFVSVPVVSGFTSAAAVIIASSQIKGLFGLHYKSDTFITNWLQLFQHIQDTLFSDLGLGVACIITLLLLRKIKDINVSGTGNPSITSQYWLSKVLWFVTTGRNAMVVIFCILLSFYLEEIQGTTPFILTANGKCVDSTQEIIALGVCNILGAFVQSLPVAGSFTRSAVNEASGVRTQMRGVITSLVVVMALLFITPYFHYIPRTALAAVVMCAVLFMVEVELIQPMWTSNRRDLVPAVCTFLSCLALGVELGLGVGVAIDVCFLLYFNARPDIKIHQETLHQSTGADLVYWHVLPKGSLLFPAIDHMRQTIVSKTQGSTEDGVRSRAIVLDCSLVTRSDFSAAQGMQGVLDDLRKLDVSLILLHANQEIVRSLTTSVNNINVAEDNHHLQQMLLLHTDTPKDNGTTNETHRSY